MSMAGAQRAPSAASWPLAELLGGFAVLPFESGPRAADLSLRSAQARPGCLCLACAGRATHRLVHAEEAVERGTVTSAAEPDADWGEAELARLAGDLSLPVIPVPNLAKRAADIAARFFAQPSQRMEVLGITAPARKTCVTHHLAQALGAALPQPGLRCAVIGSLGHGFPEEPLNAAAAGRSTPDAVTVHRQLAALHERGAARVALEASSLALHQRRLGAVALSHGVLTSLSRDHLDDHGDMAGTARAETTLSPQPSALPRWSAC
jgi:UDP-N-acetylmuramoyl-L-alanyl-D-glutamate--2,6-diaminopimelate ligase